MRHPHDDGTLAGSGRVCSAGRSREVPSTEPAGDLGGTTSVPKARAEGSLKYTFSGGYAENPDLGFREKLKKGDRGSSVCTHGAIHRKGEGHPGRRLPSSRRF